MSAVVAVEFEKKRREVRCVRVQVVQACEAGRCVLADFPVWKRLLRPITRALAMPYRHYDIFEVGLLRTATELK